MRIPCSRLTDLTAALLLTACGSTSLALAQGAAALPAPAVPEVPSPAPYGTPAPGEPSETQPTLPPGVSRGYGGFGRASAGIAMEGGGGVFRTSSKREAIAPVVVDFTNKDIGVLQDMEEDLLVMSHILDQTLERALGEQGPQTKMGVPILYTGGGRGTRALYLDGFGALFMLKVNMPLLAPAASKEAEAKAPIDSEWETARREVLGSENNAESIVVAGTVGESSFDQEQYDALKRALADALKNAGNIRHLKPDDYVSVAVFGQAAPQNVVFEYNVNDELAGEKGTLTKPSSSTNNRSNKGSKRSGNSGTAAAGVAPSKALKIATMKGTVLTLRAKKSDIAAYSAGQIGADEFANRVTTNAYPGSGYGVMSVNSWIQVGRPTSQAGR